MILKPRRGVTALAVAIPFLFSLKAGSVFAQTPAEKNCRAAVAKGVGSHLKKVLKTISKCHNARAKGSIPIEAAPNVLYDCNNLSLADPNNALETSRASVKSSIVGTCTSAPGAVANYARCPSPAATVDDGGTDGIDSPTELADCMIALVENLSTQATTEAMGLARARPSKSVAKCQKQLGKSLEKTMSTIIKVRSACQADLDGSNQGLEYGCAGQDADDKISDALTKLDGSIAKRCAVDDNPLVSEQQELDVLDACADDVAGLQTCVGAVTATRMAGGMAAMAYELPSTCNAGSVLRTLQSGAGEEFTDTFLSTGWNGQAHLVDVLDNARETVIVACDDDCRNCTMTLDKRQGQPDAICRCTLDPTVSCGTFNAGGPLDGVDPACLGGLADKCNCNFGAPLALSSGGVPACVLNRHRADLSNTNLDLGTGAQQGTINDTATVYLGDVQTAPCPICDGDTAPNDGARDGSCTAGARLGLPCDVNAVHPDFGEMSFDCPPNQAANVSGTGLFLTQPFKTQAQTMSATLPCTAPPGALCPCLVCSNDELVGCNSDADCPAGGLCNTVGPNADAIAQPNACDDGVCTCDDAVCSGGTCLAGPTEKFCDGIVRKNGRGFIQCLTGTNAECATLSAGNCTIEQNRPCYVDPIEIEGSATMFTANESALFCIPATTSAAINDASGLPGPGVVTLSPELTTYCASDSTVVWEPPGGSNCP